ncbi:exo-alpha-sialidase [uncultured Bifidobacterium sp.]|uniref:sialidase family protein n=1 Tax=uncultured Bifidobacterium sp. TaxID=165187 RepID=UPI00259AB896|nr:sialidase family protein [uncultured Bifidobacterium sp.]
MPATLSASWNSDITPIHTGTIICRFATDTDGTLFADSTNSLRCEIRQTSLQFSVAIDGDVPIILDMEDALGLTTGTPHTVHFTFGDFGTRVYLDGYQCFACASNLSPTRIADTGTIIAGQASDSLEILEYAISSEQIAAHAAIPQPTISFASASLAPRDLAKATTYLNGTIYARFRVRGPRQYGTILAARQHDREVLNISIDDTGFTLTADDTPLREGTSVYHIDGVWDDGRWHDLIIRAARGAIDCYVDGDRQLHQAGQVFFGDYPELELISIGQDTTGVRLMGEVRNGGIYHYPLTDGQIKRISMVEPTTDTALFDKGYEHSASYRIPSLITTPRGVVIAGADQRVAIANDAPNQINFVIRRSLDGGTTWLPMQTVIDYPGEGLDGASVIDSCLVCDRDSGRVILLIDHFPGGIGLPNNEPGIGVDDQGRLLLFDHDGAVYTLLEDGKVIDSNGNDSDYQVDEHGNVTCNDKPAGNIYLKRGIDPNETLLTARTSYVVETHSDDDGETWSEPRHINHMVKADWMHFLGVSPGNGIQLSQGSHRGRLLIPFYFTGASLKHYSGGALISDDGGETWRRGRALNEGQLVNGKVVDPMNQWDDDATTHESVFIERADGAVVCFFRNQNRSGRVGKAVSYDGGETWEQNEFDPALPDIFSQPNAITLPDARHRATWTNTTGASDLVVFANASQMLPYRGNGVLRLSRNGGHTWDVHRCFNPYHYVYQCMTVLPDCSLGLLWERETAGVYFTRLPLSWLKV